MRAKYEPAIKISGKKIQNVGTEERGFKEQIRWFTSCPETTWEILRVRIKTLN